jgi:hypothetical protein
MMSRFDAIKVEQTAIATTGTKSSDNNVKVADLATHIGTRQLYDTTPYATVGGRNVCHGFVGINAMSGAYGRRPIFCP